ncbi:MAG: hypothetical protein WCG87_01590 [Bacteroidota bacterium]
MYAQTYVPSAHADKQDLIPIKGAKPQNHISDYYLSFAYPTGLNVKSSDRQELTAEARSLTTDNGNVQISLMDAYSIQYNNAKEATFVNMNVLLLDKDSYLDDQQKILDALRYQNAHNTGTESADLIEIRSNGYKLKGIGRNSVDAAGIKDLSTFVLFPGNGVVVYLHFNDLNFDKRHYANIDEFKKLRKLFIDEYTEYISRFKND